MPRISTKNSLYKCSSIETLIINELFVKSWWVLLFFLVCLFFYIQKQEQRHIDLDYLSKKKTELLNQQSLLIEEQSELIHRLRSLQNFDYQEMVLIQELGVIPKNSTKIYIRDTK